MADMQTTGVVPAGAGAGSFTAGIGAVSPVNAVGGGGSGPQAGGTAATGAAADSSGANAKDSKVKGTPLTPAEIRAALTGANDSLTAIGAQLVFVFDDQTHHMAVKLLDMQTQKIVQQVPPEKMQATASALAEHPTSGALVNTKA